MIRIYNTWCLLHCTCSSTFKCLNSLIKGWFNKKKPEPTRPDQKIGFGTSQKSSATCILQIWYWEGGLWAEADELPRPLSDLWPPAPPLQGAAPQDGRLWGPSQVENVTIFTGTLRFVCVVALMRFSPQESNLLRIRTSFFLFGSGVDFFNTKIDLF